MIELQPTADTSGPDMNVPGPEPTPNRAERRARRPFLLRSWSPRRRYVEELLKKGPESEENREARIKQERRGEKTVKEKAEKVRKLRRKRAKAARRRSRQTRNGQHL